MSLRLVPAQTHPTSTPLTTTAPSAPGVPDPLRTRLGLTHPLHPTPTPTASTHPLESRLASWRATQDATRFALLGRHYGLAEPLRRRVELDIVARGEWRPAALGGAGRSFGGAWGAAGASGAGVHADILLGREAEFGWEDVFVDDPLAREVGFHAEMEGRSKMHRW